MKVRDAATAAAPSGRCSHPDRRAPPPPQALSAMGDLDRGYATLHHCWDPVIELGGTTVWEVSKPDWATFLGPNDGVPGFEDGFTSLAHPWSRYVRASVRA
jgi:hypothetical protein